MERALVQLFDNAYVKLPSGVKQGDKVTVVDDANKTIASYTVNADGDTVAVASTDIKSGATYKVTVNGTTTEVTAGTGLTEGMAGGGPAGGMR